MPPSQYDLKAVFLGALDRAEGAERPPISTTPAGVGEGLALALGDQKNKTGTAKPFRSAGVSSSDRAGDS